jgi:hypothetical protein
MRTVIWGVALALAVAVAACKSKPKDEAAPKAADGDESGRGSAADPTAMNDASAAPAADAGSGEPTASGSPGCEGWRATRIEEMGMGSSTVTVTCAAGTFTVSIQEVEPRGEAETTKKTISRDAWIALWGALDAAGWRQLPATCPPAESPPESMGITGLDLTISDGTTTKQSTCGGADVAAAHDAISRAFDDVLDAAGVN